jgi:hypothetical protein
MELLDVQAFSRHNHASSENKPLTSHVEHCANCRQVDADGNVLEGLYDKDGTGHKSTAPKRF